ncbi:MAG: HTH domain-containing protein [Rhodococcus sp. (in: high G+C Gram-positive bacteria)]|nr:HTH domain-containing protein [Rhodococcus sp. (in: high G+C Gram-positive bacteria)]MDI6629247.1 HTH domain-containing protein [Rhodococcus sp. (in: high G+C Gram-positive bacteria)]
MPKENSPQSLDSALTLRRVARQQRIGVSVRTVERDLARLRESGVPLDAVPGVHGGSRLASVASPRPVGLTAPKIAALIASLAALGPTETDSAASAMNALIEALTTE